MCKHRESPSDDINVEAVHSRTTVACLVLKEADASVPVMLPPSLDKHVSLY